MGCLVAGGGLGQGQWMDRSLDWTVQKQKPRQLRGQLMDRSLDCGETGAWTGDGQKPRLDSGETEAWRAG